MSQPEYSSALKESQKTREPFRENKPRMEKLVVSSPSQGRLCSSFQERVGQNGTRQKFYRHIFPIPKYFQVHILLLRPGRVQQEGGTQEREDTQYFPYFSNVNLFLFRKKSKRPSTKKRTMAAQAVTTLGKRNTKAKQDRSLEGKCWDGKEQLLFRHFLL